MVRVLGNTWMPIGVGGNFMPGGTSGTSAEYYKCASVAEPGTLSVNIPNNAELSGVYTYNSSNGRYVNTNGAFFLHDGNYWVLVGIDAYYYCQSDEIASDTTPIDATGWKLSSGSMDAIDMTVTIPSTWSGYKAVFDPSAGTWSFESDVTEGLTYTGLTPVVNKIYTADTTIQLAYIKLAGILNDETVKFLLYPKSSGTLEDISAGGNGVTVTNTGSVAVENNRIVFGEGKSLTIPANTLPNDIFVAGKPFLIEFQGIIPAYTSKTCGAFARKEGSMYYDRLDMYLNTIEGDSNYGQMTIGYWTNNVSVPAGAFTVGAEHVVAFEYDGSNTSRVYLDGVMQYSFTGTSYLPFRTYDFLIGHDTDEIGGSNGNPFRGNMSYFRIRNVAPYQGSNYTPEYVR